MDFKKSVARLLEKYGGKVRILAQGNYYNGKAIIQLMRYKNKMYIDLPVNELGTHDNGSYLYIGSPEFDFSKKWTNAQITDEKGYIYVVKRAHMIYCGTEPVYMWAVLKPAVKDGEYERV